MGLFRKRRIKARLAYLENADTCFPIDIFSTARWIADLKDSQYLDRITNEYGSSQSTFVRRCVLTAIRFSDRELAQPHLEFVRERLADSAGWVQYDAAWVFTTHGVPDHSRQHLQALAGDLAGRPTAELESGLDAVSTEDPFKAAAYWAALALAGWKPPES